MKYTDISESVSMCHSTCMCFYLLLYIKTIAFSNLQSILQTNMSIRCRISRAGAHKSAHFVSVTVIYNVQRFSAPCAGLLSLLAALFTRTSRPYWEMDVSL